MVTRKLTRNEHIARAMLMGRVYDMRDGTYCALVNGDPRADDMIDCETLEPIPEKWDTERAHIRDKFIARRGSVTYRWDNYDKVIARRPWEAFDDDDSTNT